MPVYIRTRTDHALDSALDGRKEELNVTIEIGDKIEYRSKENIQELYKEILNCKLKANSCKLLVYRKIVCLKLQNILELSPLL